jgi:hypothetical protein
MDGLIQIQAITDSTGWFLIGLRNDGTVWHGQPAATIKRGIHWSALKEDIPEVPWTPTVRG